MKWIAMTERKPTEEDGDECGEVLFRYDSFENRRTETTVAQWNQVHYCRHAAYWARLCDIELPPPAPVMPERIEYVRAQPGEGCNGNGFWFNPETSGICTASYMLASSGYALYRRVEPGKRIVFEVGEKRAPKDGEWYIPIPANLGPACAINDFETSRTILRLVEGQEYLK